MQESVDSCSISQFKFAICAVTFINCIFLRIKYSTQCDYGSLLWAWDYPTYPLVTFYRTWGAAGVVVTYMVPNHMPQVRFPGGAFWSVHVPPISHWRTTGMGHSSVICDSLSRYSDNWATTLWGSDMLSHRIHSHIMCQTASDHRIQSKIRVFNFSFPHCLRFYWFPREGTL